MMKNAAFLRYSIIALLNMIVNSCMLLIFLTILVYYVILVYCYSSVALLYMIVYSCMLLILLTIRV